MKHATLDLKLVDAHPQNPRTDLGDLSTLTACIAQFGFRGAVVVRPHPLVEGRYQLEAGHRRTAAARLAGLTEIPAVIVEDDDDATAVLALFAEQQQHVPYTAEEEARGWQGVLAFGDLDTAARVTGRDPELLKAARKGRSIVDKAKLEQATLDELAAIVEFEGTPELAELEEHIGKDSFEWKMRDLKTKLVRRERFEEDLQVAQKLGAVETTIDRNQHVAVNDLVGVNEDDGDALDIIAAAVVDLYYRDKGEWYDPRLEYFIDREDMEPLGLRSRYDQDESDEARAEREAAAAERAKQQEQQALAQANRYAFLHSIAAKLPAGILAVVADMVDEKSMQIDGRDAMALLGDDATPNPRLLLDAALVAATDRFSLQMFELTYRQPDAEDAAYLLAWMDALVNAGYLHTPYEAELVVKAKALVAEDEASRTCATCSATEDDCAASGSDDPACGDYR